MVFPAPLSKASTVAHAPSLGEQGNCFVVICVFRAKRILFLNCCLPAPAHSRLACPDHQSHSVKRGALQIFQAFRRSPATVRDLRAGRAGCAAIHRFGVPCLVCPGTGSPRQTLPPATTAGSTAYDCGRCHQTPPGCSFRGTYMPRYLAALKSACRRTACSEAVEACSAPDRDRALVLTLLRAVVGIASA